MHKFTILLAFVAGCAIDADPAPDAIAPFLGAYDCVTESNCNGERVVEHHAVCIDSIVHTSNEWALAWMNTCEASIVNSCTQAATCAASCTWLNTPCEVTP